METRAAFVVVGAFVLAAIAAVFGFVYWLHNTAGLGPRTTYHVQFDGSVPGCCSTASASVRLLVLASRRTIRAASMRRSR